jgi:ATP-dependent exoDNAse (exonuclease V) alpha subunit
LGDQILSLDGRRIMRQDFNKMWGAMYRAKLATNLKEAGYSVSYTKKGELRMDSVSLEVEREFSTRRAEIVAAKKRGESDMTAWRTTRKAKNPEVKKTSVLENWQARLDQYQAKTVEQNKAESLAERQAWTREAQFSVEARQEIAGERGTSEAARWQAAARRATEQSATVTANTLITEYLTELARGEAWKPITYSTAEQRLMAEVRAGRLLATDDGRYTTWEMTRADRECVRDREAPAMLALRKNDANSLVAEYVKTNVKQGLRGLSEQQAAAATGILSAERGTVVVQGDAGAGKTTMLRAVNEIAGKKGWEIVGLSIQGVAARKLQEESGISSMTVSSYLARERTIAREAKAQRAVSGPDEARAPRLIVIDEASMNDSRGLAELMRQADKHGDKLVLVGDRNQIQSVGAGRPFDRLVEEAEASGTLLSLCENYRQRDKELREAVDLARDGKMRESIDLLARTGRVMEIPDAGLRRVAVAALYDEDTLILAGSRESRDALNVLIREDLAKKGVVDRTTAHTYSLTRTEADGTTERVRRELAVGDVVTFLKNDYSKDFDVRNGERGEVLKTSKDDLTVRLEDGRTVNVDMKRYAALDYGYAMTTYKSQGQTYDKVIVEADTSIPVLQDMRNTYVQMTRARDEMRVFTDDKAELREVAGVLNYRMDTFGVDATLEKAAAMERRVHAEAFGERARQEAEAKIAQAEALAARDAEKAADAEGPKYLRPENRHVYNEQYVLSAAKEDQAERVDRLRKIDEVLQARVDMSEGVKRWTAEYLNSEEGVKTLERLRTPEEVIAAGLVESRVMFLADAVKDLRPDQKMNVEKFVEGPRTAKQATPENIHVANQLFVASATHQERAERIALLQEIDAALQARKDLSDGEKDRAATYLNSDAAIRILERVEEPEAVVAIGLVKSREMDLEEALKGLSTVQKIEARIYLSNEQIERERANKRDLGRDKGHGLDFSL